MSSTTLVKASNTRGKSSRKPKSLATASKKEALGATKPSCSNQSLEKAASSSSCAEQMGVTTNELSRHFAPSSGKGLVIPPSGNILELFGNINDDVPSSQIPLNPCPPPSKEAPLQHTNCKRYKGSPTRPVISAEPTRISRASSTKDGRPQRRCIEQRVAGTNSLPPGIRKTSRTLDPVGRNVMLRHLGQLPTKDKQPNLAETQEKKTPEEIKEKIETLARELSEERQQQSKKLQIPTPPPSPPSCVPEPTNVTFEDHVAEIADKADEEPSINTSELRSTFDYTFDYSISDTTRAQFAAGLAVRMVTLPYEMTRVVIKGIPVKLTSQELEWYLRAYGSVLHCEVTRNHPTTGTPAGFVRFSHHQQALAAIQALDNQPGLGSNTLLTAHFDKSLVPNITSTNIITNTVILRWKPPPLRLRLYYKEPRVARQEVDVINRRPFDGRPLRAILTSSQHVVFVEGLSRNADLREIVRRHSPDKAPNFLDEYDHAKAMEETETMVKEAPGLRQHIVKEGEGVTTIAAHFHSPEGAREFYEKMNGAEISWRKAARFIVILARDLLYVITRIKYEALREQIDALKRRLAQAGISLRVLIPPEHRYHCHIRITGGRWLQHFKPLIDAVIHGEVVKKDGQAYWDTDLELLHGPEIFTDCPVTGVRVLTDARHRQITVHGFDKGRAIAIKHLFRRTESLKRQIYTFRFPRWQLTYWADTGNGGRVLIGEFGRNRVIMDARACRITVAGDRAGRWLDKLSDRAPRKNDRRYPVGGRRTRCPVCLERPVEGVTLPCKHEYCGACLSRYLSSATQPGASFPFQCFGSEDKCKSPIPLTVIRRHFDHDQFELAMRRSFEFHMKTHPEEFRHCPTSDCTQMYRVQKKSDASYTARHCINCLAKFCPSCFSEGAHDGQTCAEHEVYLRQQAVREEELVEEWVRNLGGRTCPKCNMGLIKDGGCAHVQCTRCKVHICWTCGKSFEDVGEESVYEHMRREHGSIGLIEWDARGGDATPYVMTDEDDDDDDDEEEEEEDQRPPPETLLLPPNASVSGSSGNGGNGGSTRSSNLTQRSGRGGSQASRRSRGGRRRRGHGRSTGRRHPIYYNYEDEISEDEDDDFGGGNWDYDFADMNWEAL